MELNVNIRSGEKVKELIKAGQIPGIVYGKHMKSPVSVSCIKNDFLKRYKEAGYSTPLTLKGKDINQMVLIQELQTDPVTDNLIHIDFLAVSQDEKVITEVPIVLIGESAVTKLGLGKIQLIKDFIEVEAFPQDLPHNITIDVSVIEGVGDTIFVRDLKVSDKVSIKDDLEQPVVTVLTLSDEAEETPVAAATTAEGAAPVEGAAPAAGATPAAGAAPAKKEEKK